MPDNHKVESNGVVPNSPNRSLQGEQITTSVLKIQTTDNEDGGAVANAFPYPDRPGQPNCMYYMKNGLCGYGSNCRFNHPAYAGQGGQHRSELPERVGQPDCGYYLKTGTCKYGPACKYHHPRGKNGGGPVPLNSLGLPMRKGENSCPFYLRTGSCKFGVACKFNHPQLASGGTFSPVSGPSVYGFPSSSVPTSSGLHLLGAPTMSLPTVQYPSFLPAQGPQTYMPVVLAPSEGIPPAHGWNTYLGEAAFGGLVQSSTFNPYLPERPDQPECRRFMSTGSCKYGSDCKFHHPSERIAQWTTNFLGPLGLPLRPGHPICSDYSSYGLCKYGPTCKFDHPLTGYSYNNGLNFPTLPVFDPNVFAYPRNLLTVPSLDRSPPKLTSISDWVMKPEAEVDETPKLDTETPENASEHAISPPIPLPDSSQLSDEQSD